MQDQIIIKLIGWIIGIVGGLIVLCGGLACYIFKRHTRDNDEMFAYNRDDHKMIFNAISNLRDKK